ncbi:MAG: hypothetical protein EPN38_00770 [Rhodanobacteraceae bacterium]|nr:MAG: hypothetical protein EPN38_00770 [Rhodanobacteraceae bacterium]
MRRLSTLFDNPSRNSVLVGVALVLLGCALLAFTGHADRLRTLGADALGGFVLTGAAATPGPAANGQLVLAVGAPKVHADAADTQFGVTVDAPLLVRKVEMFQWSETNFGGQRNYEMDWFDHPIDSTVFTDRARHQNPGPFPISGARFASANVTVAGFKLAPALVDLIPGGEPFMPSLAHLPPNMAATFTAHDGTLVSSTDPARPGIGDLRISWQRVVPGYLTVFARDRDGTLVPAHDPAGDAIEQVLVGRYALGDVVAGAPRAPRFAWARRILAVLAVWAGAGLLLPRSRRHDRWLALAAALVPLALIAAVSWFDVRMLVFVAMVLVAILASVAVVWRWRHGVKEGW